MLNIGAHALTHTHAHCAAQTQMSTKYFISFKRATQAAKHQAKMHKSTAVCGGKRWQEISIFHTSSSQHLSSRDCKLHAAAALYIFVSVRVCALQSLSLWLEIFQDFNGKISLCACVLVKLTWKFHLTYSSGNNFIYIYILLLLHYRIPLTTLLLVADTCKYIVVCVVVCVSRWRYEWVFVIAAFVCLATASLRLPNCQRNLFMPNQMRKSIFSYLMSRKFI